MRSHHITIGVLVVFFAVGCSIEERFYLNGSIAPYDTFEGMNDAKVLKLSMNPPLLDYSIQSINSVNHARFTVANDGATTIRALKFKLSERGAFTLREGSYPGSERRCADALAPGQTCTVDVTFLPKELTKSSAQLKLSFNGAGTISSDLEGIGADIATLRFDNGLELTETYFGTVAPGVIVEKTIRVNYFGARPASGISLSQISNSFQLVGNTCPMEMRAGSCLLTLRFQSPSVGSFSQKLKIAYHNGSYAAEDNHLLNAEVVPLVTPASLSFDASAGNFGRTRLNQLQTKTITLIKDGTLPASAASYTISGAGFGLLANRCGKDVTASCQIDISFFPNSTSAVQASLEVKYQDGRGVSKQVSLSLNGSGGNLAQLSLSPSGNPTLFTAVLQGDISRQELTLSNAELSVAATSLAVSVDQGASDFAIYQDCSGTLGSGASCRLGVQMRPTAVGIRTGRLRFVWYNGESTVVMYRGLSGSGTAGTRLDVANIIDFGSVFVSETSLRDASISFVGSGPATSVSFTLSSPVFTVVPGTTCGTTIGSSCSFRLQFAPTTNVDYEGTATLRYTPAVGAPQTFLIALRGRGVKRSAALLTANANVDFGSILVGRKAQATINFNNSGDTSATSVAFSISGAAMRLVGAGSGMGCGVTIAGKGSCTFTVEFEPPDVSTYNGVLSVQYFNGEQSDTRTVQLSGKGMRAALVGISAVAFGSIAMDGTKSLDATVENTGNSPATAMGLVVVTGDAFTISSTTCGAALAAGASCRVSLRFLPRTPGDFSSILRANYLDGTTTRTSSGSLTGRSTVGGFVKVNGYHSCARTITGQLKCWGLNNEGQLGIGDLVNRGGKPGEMGSALPEVKLGTDRWVKEVALGYLHTCAILDNDDLKCWGANNYGQLGAGISADRVGATPAEMGDAIQPIRFGTGLHAVSMALGFAHTCVLLNNGKVKCWGKNAEGQLGLGDTRDRGRSASDMASLPYVDLPKAATQIAADSGHVCAVLDDKSVRCWGNNFFGQLGLGDALNRGDEANEMGEALPAISLGTGFQAAQVVTGGAFTCVRSMTGDVKCFGRNESGIIGRNVCQNANGAIGPCNTPAYPLALRGYGTRPNHMGDALTAIPLSSTGRAVTLTAGNSHVCALFSDAKAKCWGQNSFGQLGYGDTIDRGMTADPLPAQPWSAAMVAVSISSGGFHSCITFADGQARCFGQNRQGSLGVGDTSDRGDDAGEAGDALPGASF